MNLQESGEMYLETIYILSQKKPNVRSIDVVEYMNFSKPSVSRAVGILKKNGYITVNDNGFLILTDLGKEVAEKIYSRHNILSELLVKLGVNEATAVKDACRMEHVISDETYEAVRRFIEK